MASRPFQIWEKKRSKIRKRAAKHFEGLAALSTHSARRRAAVKAGCKSIYFSLDGCPLSCYFSGSVATLRDTLSTSRSVGRGTEAFIYAQSAVEDRPALTAPRHASTALFSCRENALALPGGNGIFTATPTERITHNTLLRKVVCQMGALPPLAPLSHLDTALSVILSLSASSCCVIPFSLRSLEIKSPIFSVFIQFPPSTITIANLLVYFNE